jgi:hypothetical protein
MGRGDYCASTGISGGVNEGRLQAVEKAQAQTTHNGCYVKLAAPAQAAEATRCRNIPGPKNPATDDLHGGAQIARLPKSRVIVLENTRQV